MIITFRWASEKGGRSREKSREQITNIEKQFSVCNSDLDLTFGKEVRIPFLSHFWPHLQKAVFYKAALSIAKIGLSIKSNSHNQIKLVQIPYIRDLDLTLEREVRWLFLINFWPLLYWAVFLINHWYTL